MVDSRLNRMTTFMEAMWKFFFKRRGTFVPEEVLRERLAICQDCEHHTGLRCNLCGCCANGQETLFNKVAHFDQECPDGRWGIHDTDETPVGQ